ncbi:MAG: sigma-70 family RNA polymerase sigma factor [Verrucomicrobia bacterium]|nr:sigma-70 family RNA polymerase sigma factor [Verrucomicrobiota bacterium]
MAETHSNPGGILPNPQFATTHWSVVLGASSDSPEASLALSSLCRTYWYPIYAFIRRRGKGPEDAADLTQEFFTRLIDKAWLNRADRQKGKFRSFLLDVAGKFLANEWDRQQALKRGGGQALLSLDAEEAEGRFAHEPASPSNPEAFYDRDWAIAVLENAQNNLREKIYFRSDQRRVFDELKQFLSGDPVSCQNQQESAYVKSANRLGMTEGAVKTAVSRLRERYRDCLRETVAQTVETPAQVDEEIRYLFAAAASC